MQTLSVSAIEAIISQPYFGWDRNFYSVSFEIRECEVIVYLP
jgi:hypothetical protein